MSIIINLSSQQLRHIADIKEKIDSLQHELRRLAGGGARNGTTGRRRKFKMSAAARARIAAAQRARWAKFNKRKKPATAAGKRKRVFSRAARAKIAAAARARWAKAKAAGKRSL
jgi:hypothetical protein